MIVSSFFYNKIHIFKSQLFQLIIKLFHIFIPPIVSDSKKKKRKTNEHISWKVGKQSLEEEKYIRRGEIDNK